MKIYVGNFYSWDIQKCFFRFFSHSLPYRALSQFLIASTDDDTRSFLLYSFYRQAIFALLCRFSVNGWIQRARSMAAQTFLLSPTVMFIFVYINSSLWTPSRIPHQWVVKTVFLSTRERAREKTHICAENSILDTARICRMMRRIYGILIAMLSRMNIEELGNWRKFSFQIDRIRFSLLVFSIREEKKVNKFLVRVWAEPCRVSAISLIKAVWHENPIDRRKSKLLFFLPFINFLRKTSEEKIRKLTLSLLFISISIHIFETFHNLWSCCASHTLEQQSVCVGPENSSLERFNKFLMWIYFLSISFQSFDERRAIRRKAYKMRIFHACRNFNFLVYLSAVRCSLA